MRLRRRQEQPEPVDQAEGWGELLRCFRTRSSPAMQREQYHRKARQVREVKEALGVLPSAKKATRPSTGGSLDRSQFSRVEPTPAPDYMVAAPDDAPHFDESIEARLIRRYGDGGVSAGYRW